MKGFCKSEVIKTGDRSYCLIGEWDKFDSIVAARPEMIKILDSFRGTLEDLGGGLGVTDLLIQKFLFTTGFHPHANNVVRCHNLSPLKKMAQCASSVA